MYNIWPKALVTLTWPKTVIWRIKLALLGSRLAFCFLFHFSGRCSLPHQNVGGPPAKLIAFQRIGWFFFVKTRKDNCPVKNWQQFIQKLFQLCAILILVREVVLVFVALEQDILKCLNHIFPAFSLALFTTLKLQWRSYSLKGGNDIVTFQRRQYSLNWFVLWCLLYFWPNIKTEERMKLRGK